jgi:flagellar biosynthesis anti-sigma factor FlgM
MGLYRNKPPEGQILYVTARRAGENDPVRDKRPCGEEVTDSINLSAMSRVMTELITGIAQLPEIRAGKVLAIQKALVEGTYEIDSRKIAVVLMDEVV